MVDDTGFVKDGELLRVWPASTRGCWARSATADRRERARGHRQASCPLNWRLFMPESWDDVCADDPDAASVIAARRARAAIPDDERSRPKWE